MKFFPIFTERNPFSAFTRNQFTNFQIINSGVKDQQTKMFPENTHGMQESVITSIVLTTDFLIFSNDVCCLQVFIRKWNIYISFLYCSWAI